MSSSSEATAPAPQKMAATIRSLLVLLVRIHESLWSAFEQLYALMGTLNFPRRATTYCTRLQCPIQWLCTLCIAMLMRCILLIPVCKYTLTGLTRQMLQNFSSHLIPCATACCPRASKMTPEKKQEKLLSISSLWTNNVKLQRNRVSL